MFSVLYSCSPSDNNGQSAIAINHESINLCKKPMGETFTWQNFQIQSAGWSNLIISNIEVRGDANCAFQVYRPAANGESPDQTYLCAGEEKSSPPFNMTMPPGSVQILKIDYTPSAPGVMDRADLIITSNIGTQVVIPMCGAGIELQEFDGAEPGTSSDAGVDMDEDLDSGTVDCPDCGEPLESGAPGCTEET
jgi:hypothetical protein